jgi:hypothetical protein
MTMRTDGDAGYGDGDEFGGDDWLDGPQPAELLAHVLALIAARVKRTSRGDTGRAEQAEVVTLVLAADGYAGALDTVASDGHWSAEARAAADLHLRFALRATAVNARAGEASATAAGDMACLQALAERCVAARGPICDRCGVPKLYHPYHGRLAHLNHD